ncbi:hypothetical protein HDU93_007226 [Gonapodya sp. JEL0774]|nr:hypothetical protein HDU93_007226 [Gonapodya sp. JEL0774]
MNIRTFSVNMDFDYCAEPGQLWSDGDAGRLVSSFEKALEELSSKAKDTKIAHEAEERVKRERMAFDADGVAGMVKDDLTKKVDRERDRLGNNSVDDPTIDRGMHEIFAGDREGPPYSQQNLAAAGATMRVPPPRQSSAIGMRRVNASSSLVSPATPYFDTNQNPTTARTPSLTEQAAPQAQAVQQSHFHFPTRDYVSPAQFPPPPQQGGVNSQHSHLPQRPTQQHQEFSYALPAPQTMPPAPPLERTPSTMRRPISALLLTHPLDTLYSYALRISLIPLFSNSSSAPQSPLRLPDSLFRELRSYCANLVDSPSQANIVRLSLSRQRSTPSNSLTPSPSTSSSSLSTVNASISPTIGLEGLFRCALISVYDQTLTKGKTFGGRSFDGSLYPRFEDFIRFFAVTARAHLATLPSSSLSLLFTHSPDSPYHSHISKDSALLHCCDALVRLLRDLAVPSVTSFDPRRNSATSFFAVATSPPHWEINSEQEAAKTFLEHPEWRSYRYMVASVLDDVRNVDIGSEASLGNLSHVSPPSSSNTPPSSPTSLTPSRSNSLLGLPESALSHSHSIHSVDMGAAFPAWVGSVFGKKPQWEHDAKLESKEVTKESIYASLLSRRNLITASSYPLHTPRDFPTRAAHAAWTAQSIRSVDKTMKRCYGRWEGFGGPGPNLAVDVPRDPPSAFRTLARLLVLHDVPYLFATTAALPTTPRECFLPVSQALLGECAQRWMLSEEAVASATAYAVAAAYIAPSEIEKKSQLSADFAIWPPAAAVWSALRTAHELCTVPDSLASHCDLHLLSTVTDAVLRGCQSLVPEALARCDGDMLNSAIQLLTLLTSPEDAEEQLRESVYAMCAQMWLGIAGRWGLVGDQGERERKAKGGAEEEVERIELMAIAASEVEQIVKKWQEKLGRVAVGSTSVARLAIETLLLRYFAPEMESDRANRKPLGSIVTYRTSEMIRLLRVAPGLHKTLKSLEGSCASTLPPGSSLAPGSSLFSANEWSEDAFERLIAVLELGAPTWVRDCYKEDKHLPMNPPTALHSSLLDDVFAVFSSVLSVICSLAWSSETVKAQFLCGYARAIERAAAEVVSVERSVVAQVTRNEGKHNVTIQLCVALNNLAIFLTRLNELLRSMQISKYAQLVPKPKVPPKELLGARLYISECPIYEIEIVRATRLRDPDGLSGGGNSYSCVVSFAEPNYAREHQNEWRADRANRLLRNHPPYESPHPIDPKAPGALFRTSTADTESMGVVEWGQVARIHSIPTPSDVELSFDVWKTGRDGVKQGVVGEAKVLLELAHPTDPVRPPSADMDRVTDLHNYLPQEHDLALKREGASVGQIFVRLSRAGADMDPILRSDMRFWVIRAASSVRSALRDGVRTVAERVGWCVASGIWDAVKKVASDGRPGDEVEEEMAEVLKYLDESLGTINSCLAAGTGDQGAALARRAVPRGVQDKMLLGGPIPNRALLCIWDEILDGLGERVTSVEEGGWLAGIFGKQNSRTREFGGTQVAAAMLHAVEVIKAWFYCEGRLRLALEALKYDWVLM